MLGVHNSLAPLSGAVRCSFCFVWDWPCDSSHDHVGHPEFLSVPGCIACGSAEGWQYGLNVTTPGKKPTAEHPDPPAGAGEEREMWLLGLQAVCNKEPSLSQFHALKKTSY